MKGISLFLDDTRLPSHVGWDDNEWLTVRTAKEAFEILKQGNVVDLSLDHDLGMEIITTFAGGQYTEAYNDTTPTGYDLCKWMVENNVWPSGNIYIHSSNPVGRDNMKQLIDRYHPSSEIIYHDDP